MPTLNESAADVLAALVRRGESLAVAESLTGGMLAATLTGVPGASAAFRGGVVAYATDLKTGVLGVPASVVDSVGVVSAEAAEAMAWGARDRLGATYALSTTGVAGPDPQEQKPAGTVFVALAGPGGVRSVPLRLTGDRATVREETCRSALQLLGRTLERAPSG